MFIISYTLLTLSSLIWGLREYFHKDPNVFESLLNIDPNSFFGSQQWKRKYKDYDGGNKCPRNWIVSILPYNDFWHSSWYISKSLLILGCFALTLPNNFYDFNMLTGFAIATILTMFWGGVSYWGIGQLIKRKLKK